MAHFSGDTPCVAFGRPGEKPARAHPEDRNGHRVSWCLPKQIGSGYFKTEHLPSGLSLTVSRCRPDTNLYARLRHNPGDFTLVFSLTGRSVNKNTFFKQGFEMTAGVNCLYWFPDPEMVREAPKGESLGAVVLTLPLDRLSRTGLIGTKDRRETGLPGREAPFCFHKSVNSPAMGRVLEQVLQCGFRGRARQFFLESKVLELVALKLDMISGTPGPSKGMSDRDMHGVLAARDLLLKDLRHPPSIHDLARAAGMSHPRLGKRFKSVFGCSPFELLRQKRLEWSRELVAGNDMSLTEIAYEAGFANSSHFSKAFLAYYGIQPSRYRKEKTGNPFYSLP